VSIEIRLVLDDTQVDTIIERVAQALRDDDRVETSEPGYLDVRAAAEYLGVAPGRVRKLVGRNAIPYFQEAPGCRVTFARNDLDDWMAGFRVEPRGGDA
jgi:excisionase family DNA binding protein